MNNPESDPANKNIEQSTPKLSDRSAKTISFNLPNWQVPRPRLLAKGRWRPGWLTLGFLIVAILGGFVGGYVENYNGTGLLSTGLVGQKKIVTNQSQLISQIANSVGPSVVSIDVSIADASSQTSSSPFGSLAPVAQQAAGTGIIISADGLIVTNRHVVPDGTTSVSVTLSDGTELKNVSVIGRTSPSDSLDVAFLKISDTKGHKLSPAAIGDSSNVQVGDDVVAIGNALGQFQNTVTSGIISGYGRSVQASSSGNGNPSAQAGTDTENLDNLFQTDAAINEGNSGGPLVNLNGQVIGINTAIAGNAQNIGFAIPINDVKGLINQVVKTGKFERPYLGLHYTPLTTATANQLGLSVQNGAYVLPTTDPTQPSIVSGSPAEQAGLQEKDIISQVNGKKIDQTHSLISLLNQHQPGDKVLLTIIRGGKSQKIPITLGTLPAN
jgi:serine protease Do